MRSAYNTTVVIHGFIPTLQKNIKRSAVLTVWKRKKNEECLFY
jgi:hypothetical protein